MTAVVTSPPILETMAPYLARVNAEVVVGSAPPSLDTRPAVDYLEDRLFRDALKLLDFPETADFRALASIWTKRYLTATAPAFVLLYAIGGHSVDTDLESTELIVKPRGPAGLVLSDDALDRPRTPIAVDYRDMLEQLFITNYDPLFSSIKRRYKLSLNVLWVNAANLFYTIGQSLEKVAPDIARAHWEFLTETDLDGRVRQGFFKDAIALRSITGPWGVHTGRIRKVCCQANLAHADGHYCGTCPKVSDRDAYNKLMARWQAHQ